MPGLTPVGVGVGFCQKDEPEHPSLQLGGRTGCRLWLTGCALASASYKQFSANYRVVTVGPGRNLRTLLKQPCCIEGMEWGPEKGSHLPEDTQQQLVSSDSHL